MVDLMDFEEKFSEFEIEQSNASHNKRSLMQSSILSVPTSFDWRDGNWVTDVKNQGACGSCWAFAALGGIEAKYNIRKQDTSFDLDLSEEYLINDFSDAGSCKGGYSDYAFDDIKAAGIPDQDCFNHIVSDGYPSKTCS